MAFRPINILIADDSLILRSMLSEAMAKDQAFGEIRTVSSFPQAASLLKTFEPGVIIAGTQLHGGGIGALMRASTIPVVVMVQSEAELRGCRKMGAADIVQVPQDPAHKSWRAFCSEACVKVKIAAVSYKSPAPNTPKPSANGKSDRVIVIGASTGGTDATAEIIKRLPNNLPGIVIVQHMPSGFTKMYAQRLDGISGIHVTEAKDGDRVEQGSALIAPGGLHLLLKKDVRGYYVQCIRGERVNGHCPSVGVLFNSAAKAAGSKAIGVILTGMGKDGAEGLLHMRQAGAYTIGQDKATCVVYGMPMVAFDIGAVVRQAPLQQIADLIVQNL